MSDATTSCGRYLSLESPVTGYVCRVLTLPDDLRVIAAVGDMLAHLTQPHAWEDAGGVSPLDMTALISEAIAGWEGMIGTILPMVTATAPRCGLLCDGSQYARVDYPRLYELLDAAYIIDANTFRVPDLHGRTVIGASLPDYPVNSTGGQEKVQLTINEMPSHTHDFARPQANPITVGAGAPVPVATPPPVPMTTTPAGGNQPHENMPPYLALNYYIIAR